LTYTITPLRYATQQVRGPQVFFQGHWDERIEFAFYVFLIRGHGVTAVVDCGLDDPTDINEFACARIAAAWRSSSRPKAWPCTTSTSWR